MTSLQQAYLERMQSSTGYGRIRDSSLSGSPSARLPVNPLPADALNSLQAQSDQVLRRVAALESSMTEVTRRLDDWTEVTRGGIADLRSEIGSVKLEQRFAQTLRTSPGDTCNGSPLGNSGGVRSEASMEVMGEELKKRLEVYERKLSAIHSEHMFDANSMKERLEAALRESDTQMSRADELQALMKEEQGRRALLFARLEAVEASMQDLRTSHKDFASTPEATEHLLRAEMKKEVQRLRDDLTHGGSRGDDERIFRRCEELDRRMSELQQTQTAESSALRQRLEASVRGADALQRRCDALEGRLEGGSKISEDLMQTRAAVASQESTTQLRHELQKEIFSLREELERRSTEQHQTMKQMEASSMDLFRKQEAAERQLMEWKQDHLSETVALRGRLEETVGDHHANQVGLGDIKREVNDERHRRREEMCAVRSRLEALEKLEAAPRSNMENSRSSVDQAELGETRASLQQLAKDLNAMREEHDQAISSLGSLTELVAKTATAGIKRSEERLAADLTGKRRDFELAMVQHRDQMEREAKKIIAEVKNLSPTLMAGGAGGLDVSDDRIEMAMRHIDNLARELRSEVQTQGCATAAQVSRVEGNFGADLKRMGSILSDCVTQVKGIQVELSKSALYKLEPRMAAVEMSLTKLGALQQDEISESTDTGKSRSPTDSSSDQGMKWLNTLSKVQMACSPQGVPVQGVATPLNNSRGSSRVPVARQRLKDHLHGIHNSIYQVLGVLEGYSAEDEGSAVLSSDGQGSGGGGGSLSVPLPFRPEGTFEKQVRESKGMAPGPEKVSQGNRSRLCPVNELRASVSHDNLFTESKRETAGMVGMAQTAGNSPRERQPYGAERSPSPSRNAVNAAPNLQSLVNAASGPPRVPTKGFTAPPSTGASRELSPGRQPGTHPLSGRQNAMTIRPSMMDRQQVARHSAGGGGYRSPNPAVSSAARQSCGGLQQVPQQQQSKPHMSHPMSPQPVSRPAWQQQPMAQQARPMAPNRGAVPVTRRAL